MACVVCERSESTEACVMPSNIVPSSGGVITSSTTEYVESGCEEMGES